ncbi:unnamed protein product [Effrenium voratum]|nr:unnamed protein product [Effrenium voratum]
MSTGKQEGITRKVFQKDFPTLHAFFKETATMSKNDLKERDLLMEFWGEDVEGNGRRRVEWSRKPIPRYVATLAILSSAARTSKTSSKLCMKFNGDKGCQVETCAYLHKCLYCRQNFRADHSQCPMRKKLLAEQTNFKDRFRQDPLDAALPGLGQDDESLEHTLRRLALDPPGKKASSETASAASASLTSGFAALASEDEVCDGSEADAEPQGSQADLVSDNASERFADAEPQVMHMAIVTNRCNTEKPTEPQIPQVLMPAKQELEASCMAAPDAGAARPAKASTENLPMLEPEELQTDPARKHAQSPPLLANASAGKYVLGFACHMDADMAACQGNLVKSDEKKAPLSIVASQELGIDVDSLRIVYSKSSEVAVVFASFGEPVNKFATQFLHALNPQMRQWVVHGKALFLASRNGTESAKFMPTWPIFEEEIQKDCERFEQWFDHLPKEKKRRFDQAQGPGAMLFVPVDEDKPMEWVYEDISGYEQIARKARRVFESKDSCLRSLSFCADDSDDEPNKPATLRECFAKEKLDFSFAPRQHKIVAIACKPQITMPDKRARMNVKAACIVAKLYGLSFLKKGTSSYLKSLKGDVILCMVGPGPHRQLRPETSWVTQDCEVLESEFFDFLEALKKDGADDIADDVRPLVRLEELKTWSKAWLDYGQKYIKSLQDLEEMAQPEDWMLRLDEGEDNFESGLPYLESYLQYKFAFSLHMSRDGQENGIILVSNNQTLIFATGLLSRRDLQPILAVYHCREAREDKDAWKAPKLDSRYKFAEWTVSPAQTSRQVEPLDLLSDACMQPGAERNLLQLHELKSFDPRAHVDVQEACLQHILRKRDRFEADNLYQGFKDPQGWDLVNPDRLKKQVKQQLDKVRAWCRTDRSIPVMTVFADFTYQWLVPLPNPSQEDGKLSENPTLVAVLQPIRKDEKDAPCYVLRTTLTLDMALMQELQRVVNAVRSIPQSDPEVKRAVVNAIERLRKYKECILRFLPSVATTEDCEASKYPGASGWLPPAQRKGKARSDPSAGSAAASDQEDEVDKFQQLGDIRRGYEQQTGVGGQDADPWTDGQDPWTLSIADKGSA